jgi:putative DNA primase/helicase
MSDHWKKYPNHHIGLIVGDCVFAFKNSSKEQVRELLEKAKIHGGKPKDFIDKHQSQFQLCADMSSGKGGDREFGSDSPVNQKMELEGVPKKSELQVLTKSPDLSKLLDAETFPHTRQRKDGSFKPKCTIENVAYLCTGYEIPVHYDVIGKEIQILVPNAIGITENSANTAIETINSLAALNEMPIGQVPRYVAVIADRNPINPIAQWITSQPWDGVNRISDLCDTLTARDGVTEAFKNTLIKKFLLSAVAAATRTSGFHARGVLTLQGEQGLGKTSWIRNLVPEGLLRSKYILTGHHLDVGNKDSTTTAFKHWIVELGELDSSFRKDVARLKSFVTQDRDSIRRPYARTNSEYQRRTVFCASVNEQNFLVDSTGNSRFWTIPLVKIDYDHQVNMQQVFAELHEELHHGAIWWLTPEEDRQLEELNLAHKSVSVIEERVLTTLKPDLPPEQWKYKSATEVLQATGMRSPSNPQARECGSVLRSLYGPPKKIHGIFKWKVPIDDTFVKVD